MKDDNMDAEINKLRKYTEKALSDMRKEAEEDKDGQITKTIKSAERNKEIMDK